MRRDLITPVLQAILLTLLPALLLAEDNETSVVWLDGTLLGEAMTGDTASFKSYAQAQICNEGTGMGMVVAEQEAAEIMDSLLENADPATKAQWEEEFAKSADSLMQEIAEFCEQPQKESISSFRIVYAHCRMLMVAGSNVLDVRFPPGTGGGFLEIVDHQAQQALVEPFEFTQVLQHDQGSPVSGKASTKKFDPVGQGEHLGLATTNYEFDFEFQITMPGVSAEQMQQLMAFGGPPKIINTGNAWIAPEAPGKDIVRSFYETFAAAVSSGSGNPALLGGLYNHMLLKNGLPLKISQETKMEMMGRVMESSKTTSSIHRITLVSTPEDFCTSSTVPDNYRIISVTE